MQRNRRRYREAVKQSEIQRSSEAVKVPLGVSIAENMEFLEEYNEEDRKSIMATLNVVQSRGWSAQTDDPYQFHIILGGNIRDNEMKIKN